MTRVRAMLELAERAEQAMGPDRRIDVQIEIMANPTKRWTVGEKPGPWPRDPVYGTLADFWEWATDESKEPPEINAPAYTASLDAAMTLLDESWFFHVSRFSPECDGRGEAHVYPNRCLGDDYEADAATPALAICAAALRARAADTPKVTPNE